MNVHSIFCFDTDGEIKLLFCILNCEFLIPFPPHPALRATFPSRGRLLDRFLPFYEKRFISSEKPIVRKEANQKAPLCKGSWAEGPEGLLITLDQSIPVTTKGNGNPSAPSGHLPLHKGGVYKSGKADCE